MKHCDFLELLSDSIYVFNKIDDEYTFEFANTNFLNLYKINKQILIDDPLYFKKVILSEDLLSYDNYFKTLKSFIWKGESIINNIIRWLKIQTIIQIKDSVNIRFTIIIQDITNKKNAEKVLKESEWRFQGLLNNTNTVAVQGYKMDGTVVYWNDTAADFYGYSKEEAIGKNLLDLIIPNELKEVVREELRVMSSTGKPIPSSELDLVKKDGSIISVYSSHSLIEMPDNGPELFCIDTDLTKIKEKEKELLRAQKIGQIGTWKVFLENDIVTGSPEFYRLLGINKLDYNVLTISDIEAYIYHEDLDKFKIYWDKVCNGETIIFETRIKYDNGCTWLRSINEFDQYIDNKPVTVLGTLQNITKEKNYALHLEEIAYKDYLTGLKNKYSFEQKVDELSKINKTTTMLSIHYLDIDGLYNINVKINESIGDRVICITASRLEEYIKNIGYIFCVGGDKFGIIIQKEITLDKLNLIVKEMQELVSKPIDINNDVLYITASVGTAYTVNGKNSSTSFLLRTAENALYQSKLKGKNKHTCFSVQKYFIDTKFQTKLETIRLALANTEFELYYQPKINIITNELISVEALIRWNHPTEGVLAPGEFLPYVEGHPLIVEIGDWVIQAAINQCKYWRSFNINIPISVNISSIQFEHPLFIEKLKYDIVNNIKCKNIDLILEILESGPMLNIEEAKIRFKEIKELGFKISLDDFGTGHSSLQYLKAVKPDIIKIDRSFVLNIDNDEESRTIVQAILDLGKLFNSTVIAEGLETEEHRITLIELGCVYAQGYGIGKPMPGKDILNWLNDLNKSAVQN